MLKTFLKIVVDLEEKRWYNSCVSNSCFCNGFLTSERRFFSLKSMNVISRCQSIFRTKKMGEELLACHHSFVLSICRLPGRSQDEIAKDLCLNKSTVTRSLAQLEAAGFVERIPNSSDKRQTLVYPTEKMLSVLPRVREVTVTWNKLISEGIPEEELAVFNSVIAKMEKNARKAIDETEGIF